MAARRMAMRLRRRRGSMTRCRRVRAVGDCRARARIDRVWEVARRNYEQRRLVSRNIRHHRLYRPHRLKNQSKSQTHALPRPNTPKCSIISTAPPPPATKKTFRPTNTPDPPTPSRKTASSACAISATRVTSIPLCKACRIRTSCVDICYRASTRVILRRRRAVWSRASQSVWMCCGMGRSR